MCSRLTFHRLKVRATPLRRLSEGPEGASMERQAESKYLKTIEKDYFCNREVNKCSCAWDFTLFYLYLIRGLRSG